MTWESFYCAPIVLAVMVPFWTMMWIAQLVIHGIVTRRTLAWSPVAGLAQALVVWLILFVLPGLFAGVYEW